MLLNDEQREHLYKLSNLATNLSVALKDASQISGQEIFITGVTLESAEIILDKIHNNFKAFMDNFYYSKIVIGTLQRE